MTNSISLFFYLCVYLGSYVLMKIGYNKRIARFASLLIPTLLASFRYNVGTDFLTYYNIYVNEGQMTFKDYLFYYNKTEYISFLFNKIGYLFGSFNLTLFLFAFFTLYFFTKSVIIIFDEEQGSLIYLLFLLSYFSVSLNIMRQILAVSITTYAIIKMTNENKNKFYLLVILGIFVHNTAIIMMIFKIIYNEMSRLLTSLSLKNIIRSLFYLFSISICTLLLFKQVFNRYDNYSFSTNEMLKNNSMYLSLMIFIIISLFIKRLVNQNKLNRFYYFLALLGVILSSIGFFNIYAKRITIYFDVFSLFLLSQVPYTYKNSMDKEFFKIMIILIYITLFIIQYYFLGFSNIIPYHYKIL